MAGQHAIYTHGYDEAVLRLHRRRTAANSAAYLLPHLVAGASLLDVGCGSGTITADLAAQVAPGEVVAVDAAPGMLAEAAEVAAERGVGNVRFEVADVHALGYPDDTFDVVHAHQVLQHVTDPVRALREMGRVCRPGGLVAARDGDYGAWAWYPEVPAVLEWQELYHRVARHNGGEPDAGRRLLSWARAAGLTDLTPTAATWCYATPEARAAWGGMWADRITGSSIAEQAVAYGYASTADLDRMAAGWREWSEAEDGWCVVVHGEILCRP